MYMAPAIFTGVTFGLTTCTLTQVRKKDDEWNYFFGGVAAGTVMGALSEFFLLFTHGILVAIKHVCDFTIKHKVVLLQMMNLSLNLHFYKMFH